MTDKRKRGTRETLATGALVYGKIPPQNRGAESAVLGAVLIEKGAFDTASEIISESCFYVEAHQRIFSAARKLSMTGQPLDTITVCEELRRQEVLALVGGEYYVTSLTNTVVNSFHLEKHCRIIYEAFLKRELIRLGGDMVTAGYDDSSDAFDLLDDFENQFSNVAISRAGETTKDLPSVMVPQLKRIAELQQLKTDVVGIPSGFSSLDKVMHGWQNSDLIILAARPAVGKTAFALNLARNAAGYKLPTSGKMVASLFFSLEMSAQQLVNRILASESEVWLERLITGKMEESHLKTLYGNGAQKLANTPLFIDDTPALNVFELRAKIRRLKKKIGPGYQMIVFLDYLQLMSGMDKYNKNREQEISHISRNLKMIAKEEDIPIIALSQLSRDVEKRSGEKKIPQLSDLRESGAIEQDADTVMFLYRPEYYDITQSPEGESVKGLTEVSIAKNRHGSLEVIKLRALLHIQKFIEWDGTNEPVATGMPTGRWRQIEERDDDLPFDL